MEIKTIQKTETQWQYELWTEKKYIATNGVNYETKREAFDAGVKHREELHPDLLFFGAWAGAFVIRYKTYEEAVNEAIAIEIQNASGSDPELYCNGRAILPEYTSKELDLIKHMEINPVCEYRGQTVHTRKKGEIYEFAVMGYPFEQRLEDAFLWVPLVDYWSEAGYQWITFSSDGTVKLHKEEPSFLSQSANSTKGWWVSKGAVVIINKQNDESDITLAKEEKYLLAEYDASHLNLDKYTFCIKGHVLTSRFQYGDLVFVKEGPCKGQYFTIEKMKGYEYGIAVQHQDLFLKESDLILISSRQELQSKKQNFVGQ